MTTVDLKQSHEVWSAGTQERQISTALGAINVRIGGNADGIAMVFWPSLLMNGSMWRYQYEHYAPSHLVVLVDAPGIGKSTPLSRTITLEECSECLVTILDALGINRCIFVGNSWGAILASVFAAWHPERLFAAVAANGTASPPTFLERMKMSPLIALIGLNNKVPEWLVSAAQSNFGGKTAEKSKPAFLEFFRSILGESPKSIAFQMKSILLGRKDNHVLLRTIKGVPILVLVGEEDRQFSLSIARRFAEAMPGSEFIVMPKTAHLSPRESPELFNDVLDSFIDNHSGFSNVAWLENT